MERKLASLLVVSLGMALNETPISIRGRQVIKTLELITCSWITTITKSNKLHYCKGDQNSTV